MTMWKKVVYCCARNDGVIPVLVSENNTYKGFCKAAFAYANSKGKDYYEVEVSNCAKLSAAQQLVGLQHAYEMGCAAGYVKYPCISLEVFMDML